MIEKKQKESYFNIYKKKDPSCCAIKLIFSYFRIHTTKKTYIHQNCIYINTIICYKSLSSAALYIFHQAIVVMFIPIS